MANHHFASASAECRELFRDRHFYGCIALTQAVAEALVKFLCKRNGWRSNKVYEKNLDKLFTRKFISEQAKNGLQKIWEKRDDYHHLNESIATDLQALGVLAKEKLELLNKVESEIFAFKFVDGKIAPIQPKYWDIDGGEAEVFLR